MFDSKFIRQFCKNKFGFMSRFSITAFLSFHIVANAKQTEFLFDNKTVSDKCYLYKIYKENCKLIKYFVKNLMCPALRPNEQMKLNFSCYKFIVTNVAFIPCYTQIVIYFFIILKN